MANASFFGTMSSTALLSSRERLSDSSSMDDDAPAQVTKTPDRLHSCQAQVVELKDIMVDNISKAFDRDVRLEKLEQTSGAQATVFTKVSKKLKTKFWCKNAKFSVALVIIVMIIALIVSMHR